MASPTELITLDSCTPNYIQSMGNDHHQHPDQTHKKNLEEFMARLQQERIKIEAFKRELPLCMHLLTNAMEASKKQLQSCKEIEASRIPVLEEFIPITKSSSEKENSGGVGNDKAHWMTSVQLWNPSSAACNAEETKKQTILRQRNYEDEKYTSTFLPFSNEQKAAPELAIVAVNEGAAAVDSNGSRREVNSCRMNQANRKARRCWSPDLHRRFLNALQMLGGSEVATPKQIRELMKVDGLTNDEVKSHLQKYRLHTRRPSPSSMAADGGAPTQLVVLGGIWVPPEYAGATSAPPMIYGPHPTALHQEFYPSSHHQILHQFHMYNASSSHDSPDSNIKVAAATVGRDFNEDKKPDSIYEVERKQLAAMRVVEGEESNANETTLKF
ncbi:myb family transcription factor EFM-like [Impatiens glandulifera]|uniref:myb family transcription factor EFM-like n=1 Tax=Impatiens glandulifera TaxID=253017 RepID=UPI001FB173BF|nr:myb family transcription factor EFM-like [Impatiens glandulifera]